MELKFKPGDFAKHKADNFVPTRLLIIAAGTMTDIEGRKDNLYLVSARYSSAGFQRAYFYEFELEKDAEE